MLTWKTLNLHNERNNFVVLPVCIICSCSSLIVSFASSKGFLASSDYATRSNCNCHGSNRCVKVRFSPPLIQLSPFSFLRFVFISLANMCQCCCSPYGIFHLSDPGGVSVIRNCQQRGFHPHEEPEDGSPLYEHCSHVLMNPNAKFDVIDLR